MYEFICGELPFAENVEGDPMNVYVAILNEYIFHCIYFLDN